MKEHIKYTAPAAQPLVLQPEGTLLNLSNYGNNNAPGQGFDGGNILDEDEDY